MCIVLGRIQGKMEIISFFSAPTPLKELLKGCAFLPELGLHPRNILFLERKGKTKTRCFCYSSECNETAQPLPGYLGKEILSTNVENSTCMQ